MAKSLRELAKLAGVSYVTVMRALRGDDNVRPETRDKILKLAKEHRYEPNILTHGVTGRKTMTIAVIVPSIEPTHLAADVTGAMDLLQANGYCSLLLPTGGDVKREYEHIRQAAMRRVDGMLLAPCLDSADANHFDEIAKRKIPVVLMSQPMIEVPFDCFTGADEADAVRLTEHLIELGHRRIVHVYGEGVASASEMRRTNGWRKAMKRKGLFQEEDEVAGNAAEVRQQLLKLMKENQRPTAVFSYSPGSLGVISKVLRKCNLEIAKDVSVATFLGGNLDILGIADLCRPGGIIDPSYEIGKNAAERLLTLIKENNTTETKGHVIELEGTINNGDTIGPVS